MLVIGGMQKTTFACMEMLQQEEAQDYVIATGKQYSVRNSSLGLNALGIDIEFKGQV